MRASQLWPAACAWLLRIERAAGTQERRLSRYLTNRTCPQCTIISACHSIDAVTMPLRGKATTFHGLWYHAVCMARQQTLEMRGKRHSSLRF